VKEGISMKSQHEKRCEDRQPCEAVVEWAYFNKPDFFSARLLNFSKGGSYFESEQPPVAGATILIRLRQCDANRAEVQRQDGIRTTTLGEVKWCRELPDRKTPRFGAGVRYHIPV
jgi:hypothetical protein